MTSTGTESLDAPMSTLMSPREHQVLALFRGAFERHDIGLDDDFLELGGDSMLANRLLMRLSEAYRVDLPADLLFRSTTPRALAQSLEDEIRGTRVEGSASFVPLNHARHGSPVYLMHAGSGQPWVYRSLVQEANLSRPVYGSRAPDLDWERDVLTLPEMVQHYTAAIRSMQRRGPYSIAGTSWGGNLAFDIAIRLMADGQEVRHLVLFDTRGPEPMWRKAMSWGDWAHWIRWRLSRLRIGPRVLDVLGYHDRMLRAFACFGPGPLTSSELRSVLRVAFPEFAKTHDLRGLSFEDLCRTIMTELRREVPDERLAKMMFGPTDIASIKAHKVDVKNFRLTRWRVPAGVFRGTLTIYASEGNDKVLRWQRFSSRPLDVRRVRLPRGMNQVQAHLQFLEPPLLSEFASDFKSLIEAS